MAAQFEELTEEELLARDEAIRRAAGPPLKLALPPELKFDGEPFQIPGAPDQAAVDEHNQVRLDVARDQLANLSGNESPEFLAKLRREAGVEPENVAAPANNFPTFTPPPPPTGRELEFLGQTDFKAEGLDQQPTDRFAGAREFGGDLARNALALPGRVASLFPRTKEAVAGAESRLTDVLAAEEEFGGAEGPRAAGEEARLGIGAGVDVAASAVGGVARDIGAGIGGLIDPPLEFAAGLFGIDGFGGPAEANAQEETDVTGQVDAPVVGELNTADTQDDQFVGPPGAPDVIESPTTRSNQPGVQSGVGGGGVVNRLLGPPLQPPSERGEGTEIIRGVRRTFQPDEAGSSEIPFGRGTLERFQNAGFTLEQAGDMALAAEEQEARLINAGAQDLIARTNAVTPMKIPLQDGSGRSVQGFQIIDPSATDGIRFIRTNMLTPLADDMFVTSTEIDTTDATGRTQKLKVPMLLMEVEGEFRQIPIGNTQKRLSSALQEPEEFAIALDQAKEDGLVGPERINRALDLLEEFVNKGQ